MNPAALCPECQEVRPTRITDGRLEFVPHSDGSPGRGRTMCAGGGWLVEDYEIVVGVR